jgi:acetyl-CoA carboxylase biotin carboxyl carrier protein
LELKDIKLVIDLMKKNDLSVFKLETEGFKIVLERGTGGGYTVLTNPPAPLPLPAPAASPAAPSAAAPAPAKPAVAEGHEITSPMVGTFYEAASPESPPYIKVGDSVSEETVVCIIEAMKVMNEIKAETKGVVTEVLAQNGKPVQFGQPLFRVK